MKRIIIFAVFVYAATLDALNPRGPSLVPIQTQFQAPIRQQPFIAQKPSITAEFAKPSIPGSPALAKQPTPPSAPGSTKLIITLFVPKTNDIDAAIELLQESVLRTNQLSLDLATLEQQPDAYFWLGLLFLQQVGSAYEFMQTYELTEEQQERLNAIMRFYYANEYIEQASQDKKKIYLAGLISAMDFMMHADHAEWKKFLSTTKSIIRPTRTTPKNIDGIVIEPALVNALQIVTKQQVTKDKSYSEYLREAQKAFNKELQDILRKEQPKERIKEQQKIAERKKQPAVIPVPVPIPIKGKREQEQSVPEVARPVTPPATPAIPAVPVAPQPEITVPVPQPVVQEEIPAVLAPPTELPAPSLAISPVPEMGVQTQSLSKEEIINRWQKYNRQMRTVRTADEMQKLVDELQNEKQLIEAQPYLLERAKDQLLQMQEKEQEAQRIKGMQLIPYAGKPEVAEKGKEPKITLTPEYEELLKRQQQPERWQQEMLADQERLQNLNEQLSQQLLQQQAALQPTIPEQEVTSPVVIPLAQPIAQPTAAFLPAAPSVAEPVRPKLFPSAAQIAQITQTKPAPQRPARLAPKAPAVTTVPTPVSPPVTPVVIAPSITPVPAPVVVPMPAAPLPGQENIITMLEQVVKKLENMPLPAIREKSKDKDTVVLARVFLGQALEAYQLYSQYQVHMKRQQVLIELRDWVIFFNQLEQAYIRALGSFDRSIAASYFEAVQVAMAGEEKGRLFGYLKGSTITENKEEEKQLKELKRQFAAPLAEVGVFLRICEGAAREDSLILKAVWEFITSLIVVVKDDENYPQERKDAVEALMRLLPLVDPSSPNYNEEIEKALGSARKALLNGFKRENSDKYSFYLGIIHASEAIKVYDDISNALRKLNVKLTPLEQEKYELTQLIKNEDPRAITKLQEIEQLPTGVKQEMQKALKNITPEYQEKLADTFTEVIKQKAQAGDIVQAQALVQQASKILPAQQPTILAKTQPSIAQALQEKAKAESQVKPIETLKPQEAQVEIASLAPPVQKPKPITQEEKEFLTELNKQLQISNEIIARVLDIFKRAEVLNDQRILIAYGPMLGRMIEKIQKLKQPALDQLDQTLITHLRTLWTTLSPKINPILQAAERAKVKKDRLQKITEFEQQIARRASIDELRAMVPELNMMMLLGPKEVKERAEQLLHEVEKRLIARTKWVKPV